MLKKVLTFIVFSLVLTGNAFADQMLRRVGDWIIMRQEKTEDHPQYCYIVSQPFRTKAYTGTEIRNPRFVVVYLGKDQYTIAAHLGYGIDKTKDVNIAINGVIRELDSNSLSYSISPTYSSTQDIALINDLMLAKGYFTIRSHSDNDKQALDYYSLIGFGKAVRMMSKVCKY